MLYNLDIKNVAVIENLSFAPGDGMTVLTGETGAGKSVIIDSVNMVLGDRTNKSIIRFGEEKASVCAVFSTNDEINKMLLEYGINTDEDNVIISREITSDGKSIARVNGTVTILSTLKELSKMLINIHGQHDNQSLLTPSHHIVYLDSYCKNQDLLNEYSKIHNEYRDLVKKIEELKQNEADRISRLDFLKYQFTELDKANLVPGEKENLIDESVLLNNTEKLTESLMGAYYDLYNANENAYNLINKAISKISSVEELDSTLKDFNQRLNDAYYTVEDISHELSSYCSKIENNEKRLEEVSSRLDLIRKIERKYGGSVENAIEYFNEIKNEINLIENSDEEILILESELVKIENDLEIIADKLTKSRKKGAKELSDAIKSELFDLDMKNAQFVVELKDLGKYSNKGREEAQFLFCVNPPNPLMPLHDIASGGELSRVMLAIKTILADTDSVDTLIFDEIDTGVSGEAAQMIAKKLSFLGKNKQVICISHQPQLAAKADNHFKIEKDIVDNTTKTKISKLNQAEREKELARIIDGDKITETSLLHASEMLKRSF